MKRNLLASIGFLIGWTASCLGMAQLLAEETPRPPREMSADGLNIRTISPDLFLGVARPGELVFLNRQNKIGEGYHVCLPELEGLPCLLHSDVKNTKEPFRFHVDKPVRLYAWFKVQQQNLGSMGDFEEWRLYQREITKPFSLYYRHFPAGENEISFQSVAFACAGIRALDRLTPAEQLVPVARLIEGSPVLELAYYGRDPVTVPFAVSLTEAGSGKQVCDKNLTASVQPGKLVHVPLDLPAVEPGVLHFVNISLAHRGVTRTCEIPYGLFPPPESDPSVEEPFFPYGGYDKTTYCVNDDPEIRSVYLSATFYQMRKRHMNVLVVGPPEEFVLDLAARYKVKCVVRVSGKRPERKELIEHPSVLCVMIGDEPKLTEVEDYKARYTAFREQFKTPILTCGILDGYGTHHPGDPLRIWPVLQPEIRFGRLYPFRKTHYDLLRPAEYQMWMSPSSVFQSIENDPSPWWLVPQFFGHERELPYWRIPTGPELRALMHLALAHRCGGLVGWCLHDHGKNFSKKIIFSVFLDGATMAPTAHSQLAALDEFGAKLMKAKPILTRFSSKRIGVYYRSTAEVEAAARWTKDGKICVYAVNLNTQETRDCDMQLAVGKGPDGVKNLEAVRSSTEIFTGESIAFEKETTSDGQWSFVRFGLKEIGPGDARLVVIEGNFPVLPEELEAKQEE